MHPPPGPPLSAESRPTSEVGGQPARPDGPGSAARSEAVAAARGEKSRPWAFVRKLIPVPHYMALASLDVWLRLFLSPGAWVGWAYLPRLAANLFTSYFGTLTALPERLVMAPILWWKFRSTAPTVEHAPGTVVVLGYFRSGTTHLQYLLSCDKRFKTPVWVQSIIPHGWGLAWLFGRFALIPFITNSRPQDDVALGPAWPAEDDFGVSNMCLASPTPGRFLMPRGYDHYSRFHALEGLTPRELTRWRRAQASLLWKITRLAPGRILLLKSPSHTARVAELRRMLGENVKFIHITRDAHEVVKSNVAMYERLTIYHLHDVPDRATWTERVTREYLRTEEKFLEESADLPPDRLCRIRYQDLIADPEQMVGRIYDQLGLSLNEGVVESMRRYLHGVRTYRTASQKQPKASVLDDHHPDPRLTALSREFGHDEPAIAKRTAPDPKELGTSDRRKKAAWWVALASTVLFIPVWLLAIWVFKSRLDALVWPLGAIVGWAAIRTAGVGSRRLGVYCAILTMLALAAVTGPATTLANGWTGPDYWKNIREAYDDLPTWMMLAFGMITAYRFASRTQVKPPGL